MSDSPLPSGTYDDNGELHSFDDEPATVEQGLMGLAIIYTWYRHGVVWRGDDKPSVLVGSTTKMWKIEKVYHRVNGPARITAAETNFRLYGVELTQERLETIVNYCEQTGAPLWFSWLVAYDLMTPEDLKIFLTHEGKYDYFVPSNWVPKILENYITPSAVNTLIRKDSQFKSLAKLSPQIILANIETVLTHDMNESK